MLYFMFILRIYLVCSRRCIIISIDGTSYKVEEEVEVFFTTYNKMKKKYHTVGTFSILKRKIVEIDKFDIPNTQIHDRSLS